MPAMRYRPNIFATFAIVLLLLVIYYGYGYHITNASPPNLYPARKENSSAPWKYNRDAKNLKLSDAQCDAAFPSLFVEIDRAVRSRKYDHVTLEEMDKVPVVEGFARAMIYDNEV